MRFASLKSDAVSVTGRSRLTLIPVIVIFFSISGLYCTESPRYTRSLQSSSSSTGYNRSYRSGDKTSSAAETKNAPRGNTKELVESYYQRGRASFYARKFHGRKTASGERYDQNDLTAAHRTLPFGTKVRVTNFSNGKSVVVRINDRGPWSGKKRVIDLSRAAAEAIGMISKGTVSVGIVLVE